MKIKRKKLLYKFVDLQRASSFLMDKELINLSKNIVDKIRSITDADYMNFYCRVKIFNREENCLIDEYFENGTIAIVDTCITILPLWLWLVIKPMPCCKYYHPNKDEQIQWGVSEKDINEWI